MKRGMLHIDWVISFGIFVVFLLMMFIWFGPALTREYDDEYLKDVAEKGFKEAAFAEVWEYPVFMYVHNTFPNGLGLGLGVKIPQGLVNEPIERFSIVNSSDKSAAVITGKAIDVSRGLLYFARDSIVDLNNASVRVLYSKGFNIPSTGVATPAGHEHKYNVTLGVKNVIKGFSPFRFNNLTTLNYREFKEALKYPPSKDISVFIYDDPDFSNQIYNYSEAVPTPDDNVYVVKWTDYVVDEFGNYEPIIILIKTW